MYFVLWKEAGSKKWWLMDQHPYETHESANEWVLSEIQADKDSGKEGRWEYCVAKVWTTYKAYGA